MKEKTDLAEVIDDMKPVVAVAQHIVLEKPSQRPLSKCRSYYGLLLYDILYIIIIIIYYHYHYCFIIVLIIYDIIMYSYR